MSEHVLLEIVAAIVMVATGWLRLRAMEIEQARQSATTDAKIDSVHKIVNSDSTKKDERIAQLEAKIDRMERTLELAHTRGFIAGGDEARATAAAALVQAAAALPPVIVPVPQHEEHA